MPTIKKTKKQRKTETNAYDSERRKIYASQRWKTLRGIKIHNSPLCEICEEKGLVVPAEDVHHIVSFMSTDDPCKRYDLAYDYDNLMSICKRCHQRIHNRR